MLLREGQYVPLTPKVFDTLAVLVEHGGRIVDKEELHRQVWPDTFVEDVSLAKNISTLRKILGESENNRYIETVPKRGYRFVADVRILERVGGSAADELTASALRPAAAALKIPQPRVNLDWRRFPRPGHYMGLLLAVFALAVGAGLLLWLFVITHRPDQPVPAPKTVPLTSFPGHQNQVAFSPDGNEVAFAWEEAQEDNQHIYIKMIGNETPLQVTHGPAADSKPAWSPDGRYISFLRTSADARAWYLTSPLGGERKLTDVLPYFDLGGGNSPYYSPDGKNLAIVDRSSPVEPSSIFLLSLSNLERRRVTSPPAGTTGDYYPAFSPDGKQLAFARAVTFPATDLYVLPLSGGEPRRLTFDGLTIEGLTWTSDSREIIFSSRRGGCLNSLWRVPASGGNPERVSTIGKDAISPALSPRSNRLAYTQQLDDMNIWSFELDAARRVISKTQIIASTFRDSDPDYSPDALKIAFMSERSGGYGIWVCNSDGTNPRLLFDGHAYVTGSPRWSPDGRWIAFDSRSSDPAEAGSPEIYVVDAEGGHLRRLTTGPAGGAAPTWSQDGRWIYFGSTRSGNLEIWKMPPEGGRAVQITRHGGFEGFESADGRYLYYLKGRTIPGIWRVPTGGGEEAPMTTQNQAGMSRSWRVARDGIYYATVTPPLGSRLEFFDFATGHVREICPVIKGPDLTIPGLAVSPDGRHLLCTQYDQKGSNIMMAEGFR
jgi:Tol biopolymer transport system component/DNA-binding winged helix-turn-helix (wHTH) protein